MNATVPRCAMLAEMGACAYRLGMAFGAEAERAQTTADRLQHFQLFDRCFFAVRVGLALELRLKREARRGAANSDSDDREDSADRAELAEHEFPEHERPEHESQERLDYTERDRERETERASLPLLLRTLEGVAADAAALPGPPPAALLTLQDLLARFSSDAGAAPGRSGGPALRARRTGSAAAFAASPAAGEVLTLSPPGPPGVGDRPRRRGATGPPPS